MNFDIKNLLDKLFVAVDSVEQGIAKTGKAQSVKNLIVADVFGFINMISKSEAEERCGYFNNAYLDGKYNILHVANVDNGEIPYTLRVLRNYDKTSLKSSSIKLSDLYVLLMTEIGRHYMFSKYDRKDIDSQKCKEYIKAINDYIAQNTADSAEAVPSGANDKLDLEQANETGSTQISEQNEGTSSSQTSEKIEAPGETLEELMAKLNKLIGLEGVKREVNSLINMIKVDELRKSRGFKTTSVSKHLVFLGNPGTGKTTVARLLSKLYNRLGVLGKGQLVEVDRVGLVAGYVGQTALKTKEKIDEAMGGILFIDEAYTLAKGGTDFGQEAIDTLLKAMEDNRENLVVIVAGYSKPMETFLESNPGLKSRFNKYIEFEDYSEEELYEIFKLSCDENDMMLNHEAEEYLKKYLNKLVNNKPDNFANGREMRNLFETAKQNQANRIAARLISESNITDEELNELTVEDLEV